MNKRILFVALFLCLAALSASAQMTDEAIMNYAAQAMSAGKSQTQVASELMSRGVSAQQIKRLLKEYQDKGSAVTNVGPAATQKLEQLRPTRESVSLEEEMGEEKRTIVDPSVRKVEKEDSVAVIFGQDIFAGKTLTFEPNLNIATPTDYILGPGDEVIIDIWGQNEASIKQQISPEGRIIVSQIGVIELNGLTIAQAEGKIKKEFARIYADIEGPSPASKISVTLGQIRSILVNIMGNVDLPGTYRLSSFSSVFNSLYRAGGVTPVGSMRDVQVMRGGQLAASVDIYSFIFNGTQNINVPLKEGDVIIVPTYISHVNINGGVKRPMIYELKENETLQDLINYAGGFTGDAYQGHVTIERYQGETKEYLTVQEKDFATCALKDGDKVDVVRMAKDADLYTNRIEARGAFYRPGIFAMGGDILTVKQLVEHAGGLLDEAFRNRAQIIREKADRSMEILAVPIGAIMDGTSEDILLKKNDILIVSNVNEVEPKGELTITGYVINPGKYEFADNMSVEDLILMAGGLGEGASPINVEVSRRIIDPHSEEAPDIIAEVFAFSIKDGLMVDGDPEFILRPYDVVSVRRSPSYIEQRNVSITGEVTFPGQYTITNNNYRLSQLVERAGGPTNNANIRGAMLRRQISQYERNVRSGISRLVAQQDQEDSMKVDKLKVSEIYTVGVELDKAIAHPGSDYDVILRDGDELIIPQNTTTVRVQGEVLYSNTVHFISGKPLGYYVRQAGGYNNTARRSHSYVLYMNGTVDTGMYSKVEPGCEIIVPKKRERDKLSASEILSIGSSAASIAAVVASIVSLLKK